MALERGSFEYEQRLSTMRLCGDIESAMSRFELREDERLFIDGHGNPTEMGVMLAEHANWRKRIRDPKTGRKLF